MEGLRKEVEEKWKIVKFPQPSESGKYVAQEKATGQRKAPGPKLNGLGKEPNTPHQDKT